MNNPFPAGGLEGKLQFAFLFPIFIAGISTLGWLFNPYSYWLDELYSVTIVEDSFGVILERVLSEDVHPPLYYLILKCWIALTDDSEISTRALSTFFAVASLVYLFMKLKSMNISFAYIASSLFLTNWLFSYFANETRSYSLLLLVATIVATNLPKRGDRPRSLLYVATILLSLTHFFGLILSLIVLLYVLTVCKKTKKTFILEISVMLACLIWPVFHFVAGDLSEKARGNSWIEVEGILGTLKNVSQAYLPGTGIVGAILVPLVLIATITYILGRKNKFDIQHVKFLALSASIVALSFLVILTVIDHIVPVSIARYYIVLLPFLSISISGVLVVISRNQVKYKGLILLILFFLTIFSSSVSLYKIQNKAEARQNWKGAAEFIIENYPDFRLYYIPISNNLTWEDKKYNYYLKRLSRNNLTAKPYFHQNMLIAKPALILAGQASTVASQLKVMLKELGAQSIYDLDQGNGLEFGNVVVYKVD